MSASPVSPAKRKKILRVIFISLLLDLVCQYLFRRSQPANKSRYRSHSSSPSFPSFSNFTAISKPPMTPRPSSIVSSPVLMPINSHSPGPSAIATISCFSEASWARSSPFSRQLPHPLLARSQTSMEGGQHYYGQWRVTLHQLPFG